MSIERPTELGAPSLCMTVNGGRPRVEIWVVAKLLVCHTDSGGWMREGKKGMLYIHYTSHGASGSDEPNIGMFSRSLSAPHEALPANSVMRHGYTEVKTHRDTSPLSRTTTVPTVRAAQTLLFASAETLSLAAECLLRAILCPPSPLPLPPTPPKKKCSRS